uniref:Uncharacterized protein n=1 Tax=Parascaris equorum TaxID=6256 RepID=A0A914SI99_PAREQ
MHEQKLTVGGRPLEPLRSSLLSLFSESCLLPSCNFAPRLMTLGLSVSVLS